VFFASGVVGGGGFSVIEHWLPDDKLKRDSFRLFSVLMFVCVLAGICVFLKPSIQNGLLFFVFTSMVTGGSFRLSRKYASEIENWIKEVSK
jgi:hypothetical protein